MDDFGLSFFISRRISNPEGTCKTGKRANRQPEKRPTITTVALLDLSLAEELKDHFGHLS